jgi:hypothetical protein
MMPDSEKAKKKKKSDNSLFLEAKAILKIPNKPASGWLTPVILATQEAKIRRITVQSPPQANSS